MKKQIFALLLVCLLLICALPVSAASAFIDVQVQASSAEVSAGDTVEYVVSVEGEQIAAMQFELVVPEGLRYIPGSAATPEGLAQKLGVPAADWTEESMLFTFYNDVGVNMKAGTELLRFSCKAEKAGTYEIKLLELLPFDSDFVEFTPSVSVDRVKVTGTTLEQPVETPTLPMPSDEEPGAQDAERPDDDRESSIPEEEPVSAPVDELDDERYEGPQEGPEEPIEPEHDFGAEEPEEGIEIRDEEEQDWNDSEPDKQPSYPVYKPQPSRSKLKAVLPWVIGGGIPIIILVVLLLIPKKKK